MKATVHFFSGTDALTESHYNEKEYRHDIMVEIDGLYYEVYFITEGSINNEMLMGGFISYPGLIVVEDINYETIILAIKFLIGKGYFSYFKGSSICDINNTFMHRLHIFPGQGFTKAPVSVPLAID